MIPLLLFIFAATIAILQLFKEKILVEKLVYPCVLSFFFFFFSYVWIFTKEPIGMGIKGGRMKAETYEPDWQTYVDNYSIFIGLLCLSAGLYFLFKFRKNFKIRKSFKNKKPRNKQTKKKKEKDWVDNDIPYYPGLYSDLKERHEKDKATNIDKSKVSDKDSKPTENKK